MDRRDFLKTTSAAAVAAGAASASAAAATEAQAAAPAILSGVRQLTLVSVLQGPAGVRGRSPGPAHRDGHRWPLPHRVGERRQATPI